MPKGKLDPGEHSAAAAVRETHEETGFHVRLGVPLGRQRYTLTNGDLKAVDYWLARVIGDDDLSRFVANKEVDGIRWLPVQKALPELTHDDDRDLLRPLSNTPLDTSPLVVVRHAQAQSRSRWRGPDAKRPLTTSGERQAEQLVPILAGYGVDRVISSNAVRCVATVSPYADRTDGALRLDSRLSQDDATRKGVSKVITKLLRSPRPVAVCSHRPVLPWIFEALAIEGLRIPPAGLVVVHRADGHVEAVEDLSGRTDR